jgi:hypothetical protein
MKARARRHWLLVIASAGLAAVGYFAGGELDERATLEMNLSRRAAAAVVQRPSVRPALLLELEALQLARAQPPVVELFAVKSWYVTPPPPPPQAQAAPIKPSAPPLPFAFMGKMAEADRLTVFLVKGERVYLASEGDVIDGTYKLEKIEPGKLTLLYLPLKTVQTLAVGEVQ